MAQATRWLLIGDVVVVLLFSVLGRSEHGLQVNLRGILLTAWPFLVTWLALNALFGGYRPEAYARPGAAALRAALLALLAGPLAVVLRALVLSRPIPISFVIVATSTLLILVVVWRAAFAWFQSRRQPISR